MLEQSKNNAEENQSTCCVKDEGAVDHRNQIA